MDRRALLRALVAVPFLGSCRRAAADATQHRPFRALRAFRGAGEKDDTAALLRALEAGEAVHLRAGEGSGPAGEYRIGADLGRPNLPAGAVLAGDGPRTVVKPSAGAPYIFHADSGSSDPARNVTGIGLSAMLLDGEAGERGFAEHSHLLHLDGVTDLAMSALMLTAFRGDAVMLGSGIVNGTERHNARVSIQDCHFDGVDHQNRNAISVLDVAGFHVSGCRFERCTRPDMPGAIDFEPNHDSFAILRDIAIENCSFRDIGGNVGEIAFQVPPEVERLPENIVIRGNRFDRYRGTGAEIHVNISRRLSARDPDMRMRIEDNIGNWGRRAYALVAAKDVTCAGNLWSDYDGMALLGYGGADSLLRDACVSDRFIRCGTRDRIALTLFNVSNVAIDGASFIDCGDASPTSYAIDFGADSASERVAIRNVVVESPSGRTRHAVMKEHTHRLAPATNVEEGNDFDGLPAVPIAASQ